MKIVFLLVVFLVEYSTLQAQSISAYFTKSVDNSVSSITNAVSCSTLEDTICKLIDESEFTLDIAVFDNGSNAIVFSLNAAHLRGVIVRYISSSNSLNTAVSNLNPSISYLERNAGLTSNVMHHKFVNADEKKLLIGSMNFGMGSMEDDYNNVLIISSEALCSNYTIEFNEMWGSSGPAFDSSLSAFGPAKTDNTIHSFVIDGSLVESYFSPSDNTTEKIIQAINSADYTLDVSMFTFLNNDLGDAVIAAKNRGVVVRCLVENSGYFGSEFNGLVASGISAFSHSSTAFDLHHKYCIIDAFHASSDPQVITGSHNWTNSAEEEYDENTLIVHDVIMAQQFSEEFSKRYFELGGTSGTNVKESQTLFSLSLNPSGDSFYIENKTNEDGILTISDLNGKFVFSTSLNNFQQEKFTLPSGVYVLEVKTKNAQQIERIIQF
jgi:hypothetical protein